MYLDFYHFTKEPFHITPDPEFLFLSPSHKQALGSIIYGVLNKKGFVVITGEVGVGKTTILRSYLEKVDKPKVKIIYIFNAALSFKNLLNTIYKELELDAKKDDVVELLDQLYPVLLEEYKQGHIVLLVIDEAQNMSVETLENLRMLSNLETSKDKLLQIVLIGQTEFQKMLNLHELRQLQQRIAIRFAIIPFTQKESFDYIKHRLAMVATDDTPVFTRGALRKIVREAKGIPRNINILCDNALITGFGYEKKPVNTRIVKEVIADFRGKAAPSLLRWALAPAALILLIAGLFFVPPSNVPFLFRVGNFISPFIPDRYLPGAEKSVLSHSAEGKPAIEETGSPAENPDVSQTRQAPPEQVEVKLPEVALPEMKQNPDLSAEKPFPVIMIVKKGDSLLRLTRKVYGYVDDKLLEGVKQSNPGIKNIHKILIGEKIIFPEIVGSQDKVKAKDKDKAKEP